MKKIVLNNCDYEVLRDDADALNMDELTSLCTDYFMTFDYILGDYSYGKLRLKGFYDSNNKKATNINKIERVDEYIQNYCAFNCKYFILKKKKRD